MTFDAYVQLDASVRNDVEFRVIFYFPTTTRDAAESWITEQGINFPHKPVDWSRIRVVKDMIIKLSVAMPYNSEQGVTNYLSPYRPATKTVRMVIPWPRTINFPGPVQSTFDANKDILYMCLFNYSVHNVTYYGSYKLTFIDP